MRKWLRAGARGWRLDVADELSDGFIEDIKAAMVAERPDGALVGEVWEDASNKMAYGKLRQYFEGTELDGTMNYPLRTALLAFVRNEIGAPGDGRTPRLHLCENYPREAFWPRRSTCWAAMIAHASSACWETRSTIPTGPSPRRSARASVWTNGHAVLRWGASGSPFSCR